MLQYWKLKRGYFSVNILAICFVIISLFTIVLTIMANIKKSYRAKVNEYEIKCLIEARAMTLASSTNLTTKVGLGYIADNKFFYQVEKIDDTKYKIMIKHFQRDDLIYYQIFSSRYTVKNNYNYVIHEEGYIKGVQ